MFKNIFSGKKVLVTGHTGFKGSWLSKWLINLGAEVAGFSLYKLSFPNNFEILGLEELLKHYSGDVRDKETLTKAFKDFQPDIIFHLAAQAIVRTSYDQPKSTFDTNLGGTINILELVREISSIKTAVFITSDKCYENMEWEYGYRESDRLGGKDPYSASKACAELAISSYFQSFLINEGKNIASTRAGNVIGGGDWAQDRIVPDCIRSWANNKILEVRSPEATRPWQHVFEPLSGYLWLAASLDSGINNLNGEAFNFGPNNNMNYSVYNLVKEMSNNWPNSKWAQTANILNSKAEAGLLNLCCDKTLNRLGWKAVLNFNETVKFTTDWYKAYYENNTNMKELSNHHIEKYAQLAQERNLPWIN